MQTIYDLDTPTLLVDLDQLERNISDMAILASRNGKVLRPHIKTHKCPDIARLQMAAGARGLTVAKLGEAEVMADAGFDDIFIANEVAGPIKIGRLMGLAQRIQVRVAVDSMEIAEPLGTAGITFGVKVPVLIEVDTGLGRAGVRSLEEAVQLAERLSGHSGIWLAGIFTHEGQLYRGKNGVNLEAAAEVAAAMRDTAAAIRNRGIPCEVVSVGSTPGAPVMAPEPGLDELRPGVYVFNDRMQVSRGGDPTRLALSVLASVVSVRPDGVIIIDAGSKSMASDCPFEDRTYGEVVGHPELLFAGISEEHGHLRMQSSSILKVGDKIRIVPNHACTCVNMYDSLTLHRQELVEAVLPITARGKIQ